MGQGELTLRENSALGKTISDRTSYFYREHASRARRMLRESSAGDAMKRQVAFQLPAPPGL